MQRNEERVGDMANPASTRHIFVSHSHHDNSVSQRIVAALQQAGFTVWYDEQYAEPGHLAPIVENELRRADTFIVVLSPAALTSNWVRSEWYAAWELHGEGKITTFIPVIAESCEVPLLLRGMRWVDASRNLSQAISQLLRMLGVEERDQVVALPRQWGLERTIRAHPVRGCFCIAWSPDGRSIASGSYDRSVRIWDATTGECVRTLNGHTQGVDAVAWSPDGALLASASLDMSVQVWDVTSWEPLHTLHGQAGIVDVAWSPDGKALATAGVDGTLSVWEVATNRQERTLVGHTAPATSVAWSPDGRWIGSTSRDATIRLWHAANGTPAGVLTGHNLVVYCVRWSPDGSILASSGNTTVRLWSAGSGALLHTLTGHSGYVLRVAWRPDGRLIASGSADRAVGLWDARAGTLIAMLGGHSDWVHGVTWSPDGGMLASCGGTDDGTIKLWAPR